MANIYKVKRFFSDSQNEEELDDDQVKDPSYLQGAIRGALMAGGGTALSGGIALAIAKALKKKEKVDNIKRELLPQTLKNSAIGVGAGLLGVEIRRKLKEISPSYKKYLLEKQKKKNKKEEY